MWSTLSYSSTRNIRFFPHDLRGKRVQREILFSEGGKGHLDDNVWRERERKRERVLLHFWLWQSNCSCINKGLEMAINNLSPTMSDQTSRLGQCYYCSIQYRKMTRKDGNINAFLLRALIFRILTVQLNWSQFTKNKIREKH